MHMLYVQLLDSSKASKTLAFAILARGLSFESGKLTRIIHIAWYGSADPANTVQEAVATSRDAKFLWQTLKAPDDDRVTVTCVANPIQVWPLNSCGTACSTWKLLKGVHFQIFFHQSLEHILVEDASFTTVTWQHGAGLHSNQDESSPVPCHTLPHLAAFCHRERSWLCLETRRQRRPGCPKPGLLSVQNRNF